MADQMSPGELLLADLEHFGESMWRNEDVGEKRLNFFMTLTTAVVAGLVALAPRTPTDDAELFHMTAGAGLGALLIIGLLSYLRMIHRNKVTDQYQATIEHIRTTYRQMCAGWEEYKVPVSQERPTSRGLRGGYAETFAVLDGMLLAGFLLLGLRMDAAIAGGAGAAAAIALVTIAALRKKKP